MSVPTPDNPDAAPVHERIDLLEIDETVPPRPEEDIADAARSTPDPHGHGGTGVPHWSQVEAPTPTASGDAVDRATDDAEHPEPVDPAESTEPVAPSADDPRP